MEESVLETPTRALLSRIGNPTDEFSGGAAAAVSGAAGTALLRFCLNHAAADSADSDALSKTLDKFKTFEEEFLRDAERDAKAYQQFLRITSQNNPSDLSELERDRALEAIQIPLLLGRRCRDVLKLFLEQSGAEHSDLGGDIHLGQHLLKGTWLTAKTNIQNNIDRLNKNPDISDKLDEMEDLDEEMQNLFGQLESI